MKRTWFTIGFVAVLVLALGASQVLAQSGIVFSSAYQIQNLEASTATVLIQYYDQTTGNLAASGTVTVAGSGSKTLFPFVNDGISGPSPFNGSAVLSSDKRIAAILNTQTSSSPFYGASTNGFSAGATSISLPLIACNNSGFNTWFNVQNTGSSDANVKVTYIPGSNGTAGLTDTATVKSGAAKTFNQTEGSGSTKTCAQLKDGSGKFIGSAKVESTNGQPLVATVMFLGSGGIKTMQGYNAFISGSNSVNLPLIMANNSSYYTAIQVQNAGSSSTTVTVTFGANTVVNTNRPNAEVFILAGGQAKTLIQAGGISSVSPHNNWSAFGKYVSGATITQSGTQPLVAIVNQNSTTYTSLGSAYEGFDPGSATATINLPLIAANNSGYLTGIQIQAVTGAPVVTVDYSTNTSTGSLKEPVNDTCNLSAPGKTCTLIQAGGPGGVSGNNNWGTAGKYVGSAKVTATGGTIIAIVNFNGPASAGDTFFTYDGFNQ